MPRFRYRMQSILDIKLKLEEQARNEYAQAQLRLNEELDKKQALLARLAGYEEESRHLRESTLNVRELNENRNAISVIEEYIRIQELEVKKARKALEEKREALSRVMQERKMHEKLKEKALEEYLEEERTDLSPVQLPENRDCRAVNLAEKIYAHYDVCSGSSGNAGSEGFSSEKSGGENHEI